MQGSGSIMEVISMSLTKSGIELKEVIEKAISDGVITNNEYKEILKTADSDEAIDGLENRLLSELQKMISDGTVKRVN